MDAIVVFTFHHCVQKGAEGDRSHQECGIDHELATCRHKSLPCRAAWTEETATQCINETAAVPEEQYEHEKELSYQQGQEQAKDPFMKWPHTLRSGETINPDDEKHEQSDRT